MLGTRGEHTIRLIYPFGHQIVDEHADVSLITTQHKGLATHNLLMRIDTRHQTLTCCLLIACSSIYLTGKIKASHTLGLQRMMQLCGVEIVILDGVSRAVNVGIGKSRNLTQSLDLHLPRQRRTEAVEVAFVGRLTLRLNEELVTILVGKRHDLGLYAGAITWSHTIDLTIIER